MQEQPLDTPETLEWLELREAWPVLARSERMDGFLLLDAAEAEELFFSLDARSEVEIILALPQTKRRAWMRLLPPDDAADVVQAADANERAELLALLDEPTRREVMALLAYAEDDAGGLMNPRYARVRPDMSTDEAMSYLRKQARERVETIYYVYVLDAEQRLLGVVSLRELFSAPADKLVRDFMKSELVTVPEQMDQEVLSRLFSEHGLAAIPVVSAQGQMKGIVTVDDIVDVVQEEATEDIQKLGGTEALDEPYLQVGLFDMIKKRAGWLSILFLGEMLTATAMSYFEHEISRAVVLALFVPLIISSGGNSGSQATTLVIRAMSLGEVRLRDWWRVIRREFLTGLSLGVILGTIGFLRIFAWEKMFHMYGTYYMLVGMTVAFSLVGVVLWGTLIGSMLPFAFRRLGFDPASASAPFVATFVDVSGLVIYFSVASMLLTGALL